MTTAKRTPGRPKHAPTEKTRAQAEVLAASGVTEETIASCLGITRPTLRVHYEKELTQGREMTLAKNTAALVSAARQGNITAMIYLQKCLGGTRWRENQSEHTGEVTLRVVYDSDSTTKKTT